MKKGFIGFLLLVFTIQLVACRNIDGEDVKAATESVTTETTMNTMTESSTPLIKNLSDSHFENEYYQFVIENTEQIKNDDDLPLLAIKAHFTNNSEQAITPWMAFITSIRTIQKNDNEENSLNGANGLFPEDYQPALFKASEEHVLPGESVETLIGFVIEEPGKPIIMSDLNLLQNPEQFQREIPTTK